jgi:hypothetical protein
MQPRVKPGWTGRLWRVRLTWPKRLYVLESRCCDPETPALEFLCTFMKIDHPGWSSKDVKTTSQDKKLCQSRSDSKFSCDRIDRYPIVHGLPIAGQRNSIV